MIAGLCTLKHCWRVTAVHSGQGTFTLVIALVLRPSHGNAEGVAGSQTCLLCLVALIFSNAGLGDAHAPLMFPFPLPRPVMVIARPLSCTISIYLSLLLPVPAAAKEWGSGWKRANSTHKAFAKIQQHDYTGP